MFDRTCGLAHVRPLRRNPVCRDREDRIKQTPAGDVAWVLPPNPELTSLPAGVAVGHDVRGRDVVHRHVRLCSAMVNPKEPRHLRLAPSLTVRRQRPRRQRQSEGVRRDAAICLRDVGLLLARSSVLDEKQRAAVPACRRAIGWSRLTCTRKRGESHPSVGVG